MADRASCVGACPNDDRTPLDYHPEDATRADPLLPRDHDIHARHPDELSSVMLETAPDRSRG